jgi:diguanylate cyclase (GGDEF)-like protein
MHAQHDNAASAPLRRWSVLGGLQFKMTGLVVLLTLSVTAGVSAYLMRDVAHTAQAIHEEELTQLAAVLARASSAALASGDERKLQMLAGELSQANPLLYVAFTDVHGQELARASHQHRRIIDWLRTADGHSPWVVGAPRRISHSPIGEPILDIVYPVRVSEDESNATASTRLVGHLRTGIGAGFWQTSLSHTVDVIVGMGVIGVALAIPLGFMLVRRIVAPLDSVCHAMREFSDGNLDVRSEVRRSDELGLLAYTFNKMADEHQRTHQRIIRMNVELEERVQRRTKLLHELASREPLTGLYNRRYFNEMFERHFSQAVRHGSELTCIMMDLDDFKGVNDKFGHHAGDEVLVLLAATLTSQLRAEDVPARFGGDELIVILPQTDAERARVLAERVCERFDTLLRQKLPDVRTSLSIGIAGRLVTGAADTRTLVRLADRSLYEAKDAGKNCIVVAASDAALSRT